MDFWYFVGHANKKPKKLLLMKKKDFIKLVLQEKVS